MMETLNSFIPEWLTKIPTCPVRILLIMGSLLPAKNVCAQEGSLLKVGGMVYFYDSKYTGYSFHLEYESAFSRNEFLTSGPRFDFVAPRTGNATSFLGYAFRIYPMYGIAKRPYNGLFIGADPLFVVINPGASSSRYGPGIGMLLGYQQVFRDRLAISLEASPVYMRDINKEATQHNSHHGYWYAFASLKFALKLNGRKN